MYIGEFREGKKHGEGTLIDYDDNEKKGRWHEGTNIEWY